MKWTLEDQEELSKFLHKGQQAAVDFLTAKSRALNYLMEEGCGVEMIHDTTTIIYFPEHMPKEKMLQITQTFRHMLTDYNLKLMPLPPEEPEVVDEEPTHSRQDYMEPCWSLDEEPNFDDLDKLRWE